MLWLWMWLWMWMWLWLWLWLLLLLLLLLCCYNGVRSCCCCCCCSCAVLLLLLLLLFLCCCCCCCCCLCSKFSIFLFNLSMLLAGSSRYVRLSYVWATGQTVYLLIIFPLNLAFSNIAVAHFKYRYALFFMSCWYLVPILFWHFLLIRCKKFKNIWPYCPWKFWMSGLFRKF